MTRIVIEPLKEEYKVVVERTTSLESFFVCPYSYKNGWGYKPTKVEKQVDSQRTFLTGHKLHEAAQAYALLWPEKYQQWIARVLEQMGKVLRDDKEIGHFVKMINAANEMYSVLSEKYKLYEVFATEYHLYLEIECWDILLILTGTADAIAANWDKLTFIDWKTSKEEYSMTEIEGKIQKYSYPWMLMNIFGADKLYSFDYLVITKHAKPRCQRIPMYFSPNNHIKTEYDWYYRWENLDIDLTISLEEVNSFMVNLIKQFVNANKNDARAAKNTILVDGNVTENKSCIWCCLRNLCPAHNWLNALDSLL